MHQSISRRLIRTGSLAMLVAALFTAVQMAGPPAAHADSCDNEDAETEECFVDDDGPPGVARARESNCSKKTAPCSAVGYPVALSDAVSVMTRSPSKPSGTLTMFHRLRSSNADPPSSATVSAICVVTSANRTRGLTPDDERLLERSRCNPPTRNREIAGHGPIASPVRTASGTTGRPTATRTCWTAPGSSLSPTASGRTN